MSGAAEAMAGWIPVWADEFDIDGPPDPALWRYLIRPPYVVEEIGLIERTHFGPAQLGNARVSGGCLEIEARKVDYPGVAYMSACLAGIQTMTSGRILVRAKLPTGRGAWPAIWMLGSDIPKVGWPACGEIDILEFVGKEPDNVYSTLHFKAAGVHKMNQKRFPTLHPSGDFHVYAMEWYPDRIDFLFDGARYQSAKTDEAGIGADNPFRKPQKLLINMALGGSWGGEIDDSMLPQKYLIDYVRIYKSTGSL